MGSTDDLIQRIASQIDETVSTGGIAMGPMDVIGPKISRKRKKRRGAKGPHRADPITGKPSGNADVLGESEESTHSIVKNSYRILNPKMDADVPALFNTGIIPGSTGQNDPDYAVTQVRVAHEKLRIARQKAQAVHQALLNLDPSAGFISDFRRIKKFYPGAGRTTYKQAMNDLEVWVQGQDGLGVDKPRSGWWGIRNWNTAANLNYYLETFIDHIFFIYFKGVQDRLAKHIQSCEECKIAKGEKKAKHIGEFLLDGYSHGFASPEFGESAWTLNKANEYIIDLRRKQFLQFDRKMRGKQRPEPSRADVERLKADREIERTQGLGARINRDVIQDYGQGFRKLFGLPEPGQKSEEPIPQSESAPLDISRLLTDDPDILNDPSI